MSVGAQAISEGSASRHGSQDLNNGTDGGGPGGRPSISFSQQAAAALLQRSRSGSGALAEAGGAAERRSSGEGSGGEGRLRGGAAPELHRLSGDQPLRSAEAVLTTPPLQLASGACLGLASLQRRR